MDRTQRAVSAKHVLGSRLKEWRKQRKLTQEDLAFKIGRSTEAVSMLERGINNPAPETIDAISKVLDIPVHEFYKTDVDSQKTKKQEVIDNILGMLHLMDNKKLIAVEKQVKAMLDV